MAVKFSAELEQFRLQCIADGEAEHELMLRQFPHRLRLWFGPDTEANCDRMMEIERFLSSRLNEQDYVAFPGTSIGQYKQDIFCVFFRNAVDAMIMKLTL